MAEAPRTFWQYLKGPMHTFELHLSPAEVLLKEYVGVGAEPKVQATTLSGFLDGELHAEIAVSMNADVLPAALESAKRINPTSSASGQIKNSYLIPILKGAVALPSQMRAAFGKLSVDQLNWKPSAETWSIGECIDHLITTNRTYFAQLEAIARGDKYVSFWEKLPLFHGMWGRMLIKATTAEVAKKGNSPAAFKPTRSTVPATIVEEFCSQQADLIAKVKKTDQVDHETMIISSPAASFITYSLHDGLVIVFQHEERHFRQALAVMARPEFPKG
jgi:hypothetical protein